MGDGFGNLRLDGLEHHLENKFYTDDLGNSYPEILEQICNGRNLPSRNGDVWEIDNASLVLTRPERCIVARDGFSHAFMDTEILLLLSGRHEDDLLRDVTPRAADMITPLTAYGPRTAQQLLWVERELRNDPLSRRGVVYVGRHDDLSSVGDEGRAGEMPCTCLWQFMVRPTYRGDLHIENALFMTVYMRSWDAVWGLSYDVPSFVSVQMALAKSLGVTLGHYRHHAGSLHIYKQHSLLASSAHPSNSSLDLTSYLQATMRETQLYTSAIVDHRLEVLNA